MKVSVELISDKDLLEKVKPLMDIAMAYEGHLNYSYTKGVEFTSLDISHKQNLLQQLRSHPSAAEFVIGGGSGHIYVNRTTACTLKGKANVSTGGIHDRILLITDPV